MIYIGKWVDDVRVYLQPVISNSGGELVFFEALVRLNKGNGGIVLPKDFLGKAREEGWYNEVTLKVIDKSVSIVKNYGCNVSVNVSYSDIFRGYTRECIYERLSRLSECRGNVYFEIVETEEIKDYNVVRDFIQMVRSEGSKVFVDDFGSGYSNVAGLLGLGIDGVKIDGEIVRLLEGNRKDVGVVIESVVNMCKDLSIKTVAEYVSNEVIFDRVCSLGVDYSQGYYIGRPLEISEYIGK